MDSKFITGVFMLLAVFSCKDNQEPIPYNPPYEVLIKNEFNELQARYAVFASNKGTGDVLAFRWVPGEDTIQLQVPGSTADDYFDITVLKYSTLVAPGTGVRDTFLNVTTYTNLPSSQQINFKNQEYQSASLLSFNLSGMNSLDSIMVPEAFAITRPSALNTYLGEYYCYHTGKCWMRIMVNGEPFWRFVRFDGVNGPSIEANMLDANLFLPIFSPSIKLNFPFYSEWKFKVDGVVDTAKLEFFPLSPQLLVPGSATPATASIDIFEPVNNDQFDPNRPYKGFRIQANGTENTSDGYTYICDQFFDAVPSSLPIPDFDLLPTILSDKRLIAVQCVGDFDLLAFSRSRDGEYEHFKIKWEVFTRPVNGIVSYRLPDVPSDLGNLYPHLKNYAFNSGVKARAESYEKALSFEELVSLHLLSQDVIWQAKAGYLAKEREF